MDIYNVMEDFVVAQVDEICNNFEKEKHDSSVCTCPQCRQDTVCYVLNRVPPRYIVSHRGAARVGTATFEEQQDKADVVALIYEGIRRVSHNQRPYADHADDGDAVKNTGPLFNIPTIIGKAINGLNFEPVSGCAAELSQDGSLVKMKDHNWQNPYSLIPNTQGAFTFWPAPIPAEKDGAHRVFRYSLRIAGEGFEELNYAFTIPVRAEIGTFSFSMERAFRLPDLYLFPPGEEKRQLNLT
jgi:competence protein ComFB